MRAAPTVLGVVGEPAIAAGVLLPFFFVWERHLPFEDVTIEPTTGAAS